MLIQSFNMSAQGAIESAGRLAVKEGHAHVSCAHMLWALLDNDDTGAKRYVELGGADGAQLYDLQRARVNEAPKSSGGGQQTPISRELEAAFIHAEESVKELGNKYIGSNHILMGMLKDDQVRGDLERAGADLEELAGALKNVSTGALKGHADLSDYELLAKYTVDLTERARSGKLDPVIGRDSEIRQVIQVLSRRLKNNPVIVGEPGVGKTALVEGLAQRVADGSVPDNLADHLILALDIGQLIAGTKFRGEFEERFKGVLGEVAEAGNILLFIDEIHMLVGAGGTEGGTDASNMLKPALSRGEFRCVGSTTLEEYRKRIEKDSALSRRFQKVTVEEPTLEQATTILRGLKETYEVHHGVRITDPAIHAAVRLSSRYISDRFLPDKAIDVVDQAAASVRMELASRPEAIEELQQEIVRMEIEVRALEQDNEGQPTPQSTELRETLKTQKGECERLTASWQKEKDVVLGIQEAKKELEDARRELEARVREQDYERVVELQYTVIPEREKRLEELNEQDVPETSFLRTEIEEADIADTVSKLTGIPVSKVLGGEREKLLDMEKLLAGRVVGQDEAVEKVSKAVRRARAGMQDPNRPLASFLMLGPTGVGKTELCKALAELIFDDEHAMVRIDMSEFMEKHSVARLVGAPPGYVGFDEGGVLTNQVKQKPYSVVLLDEVEKAHGDVFNILLQVLDDGHLSDSQGNLVNFKNTIIILTSNLGGSVGSDSSEDYEVMRARVLKAVEGHFRPEFINRLDDTVVFRSLAQDVMRPITQIQLNRVAKLLAEQGGTLDVSDDALGHLAQAGYDPAYGARPLKRVIQRELQDAIAELIIHGDMSDGATVHVGVQDGALKLSVTPAAEETREAS